MLRALDPPGSVPAYAVPWCVDRADVTHPVVHNTGGTPLDAVRAFVHDGVRDPVTEHLGRICDGELVELCLCDYAPDRVLVTLAWFRPGTDDEYLWRFSV